jgi:hypothetical protein
MGLDVKNYLTKGNLTSPSPTPSSQPSVTISQGGTVFQMTICPHGIGNCGDNANPNSGGNTNPLHQQRTVTLTFLSSNNQLITTGQGTVSYNQSAQNFQGTVSGTIQPGQYIAKVRLDGFLQKQVPGIVTITQGQHITFPLLSLVNGDTGRTPLRYCWRIARS